jgi:hypothetical protein
LRTQHDAANEPFAVEGEGEGATHARIDEGSAPGVEGKVAGFRQRMGMQLGGVVAGVAGQLGAGHVHGDVHLIGAVGALLAVAVVEADELDLIQLHFSGAVVGGVPADYDSLLGAPLD